MKVLALLVILFVAYTSADMYLHNPPGSNDRCRERNDNRNNGNRLFDSQNNGAGGYAWRGDPTIRAAPDPLTYYMGSKLRMEWTNQHACGQNLNTHCTVSIQFATEDDLPGLRDGYPDGDNVVAADNNNQEYKKRQFSGEAGQNQQCTNTIPENQYANDETKRQEFYYEGKHGGVEFGMHEGVDYYDLCKGTVRNFGLYNSDQNINRNDARGTRQNPNGQRRGLECPEERDYQPYWRPSPFRDVAFLVSDVAWCPYYQQTSQNVVDSGWCDCDNECKNANGNQYRLAPITQQDCSAFGGTWRVVAAKSGVVPECRYHSFGRDNHLGNTLQEGATQPETAHYEWTIPNNPAYEGKLAVVRFRYNISTGDYPSMLFAENQGKNGVGFNSAHNCPRINSKQKADDELETDTIIQNPQCFDALTVDSKPLYNRPYVSVFENQPKISIALNTNQAGRTFQDRSYVFRIASPPAGLSCSSIVNLNVRGRRGNIVQAYPAVEYDFVPSELKVSEDDCVHIQIHGSDFNAAKNANNGEGWQYSDRSNLVQLDDASGNYPAPLDRITMFRDSATATKWALLDQDPNLCKDYEEGDDNEQNSYDNCGKLNQAPQRFPPNPEDGLTKFSAGSYSYASTRNNNFSNRSQKASLTVSSSSDSPAATIAIIFGSVAAVGVLTAGVCFYGKKNPDSAFGGAYSSTFGRCGGGSGNVQHAPQVSGPSQQPQTMVYRRH